MNIWPPPTLEMSADELKEAILVARQFIVHAETELPYKCKNEGHAWDNEQGKLETVYGEDWQWGDEGDPAVKVATCCQVYTRKCLRCGVTDSREPLPTSPFTR